MSTRTNSPTVDDVIDGLREHVWILLRAEKVDAAMVLLRASLDDYMQAVAAEKQVIQPLEGVIVVPPVTIGRGLVRRPTMSPVFAPRKPTERVNRLGDRVNGVESTVS